MPDVFDVPEAEPTEVFVNPFACSINPLDWREVQVQQHGCSCEPQSLRLIAPQSQLCIGAMPCALVLIFRTVPSHRLWTRSLVPVRQPRSARAHVLQALVDGAEEPEAALQRAGLFFNDGAVAYLTPAQKAVLVAELEDMEARGLTS